MEKLYFFNVYTCKSLYVITVGPPYGLPWGPIHFTVGTPYTFHISLIKYGWLGRDHEYACLNTQESQVHDYTQGVHRCAAAHTYMVYRYMATHTGYTGTQLYTQGTQVHSCVHTIQLFYNHNFF